MEWLKLGKKTVLGVNLACRAQLQRREKPLVFNTKPSSVVVRNCCEDIFMTATVMEDEVV